MNDGLAPTTAHLAPLVVTLDQPSVPLEQNPAAIYLSGLSPESRRTMRTALNTLAAMLGVPLVADDNGCDIRCLHTPWTELRYQHTAAIRAQAQERYAPATANKLLAALRRVLKEARRLNQISADDYDAAVDVKNIRGQRIPRGRLLSDAEVAALMRVCVEDATPAGARDAALIGDFARFWTPPGGGCCA
jgi:hypothetical protein